MKTGAVLRREYRRRHPQRVAEAQADWYQRRGWHIFAMNRRRKKVRALAMLGGRCVLCGERDADRLTFDHVNGDGREGRKNNSESGEYLYSRLLNGRIAADRFRVLCYSCNISLAKFGYNTSEAVAALYCRDYV